MVGFIWKSRPTGSFILSGTSKRLILKDYLIYKGFSFKTSPKDTIRQAQESKLIDYGQSLIDGLDIRNDLSHDYSVEKFDKAEQTLREEVYPALAKLYNFFKEEVNVSKSE